MNGDFEMETNDLFKLNFLNAKVVYDNNMSYYLNKKKSNGKIDMVAAPNSGISFPIILLTMAIAIHTIRPGIM